MLVAKQGEQRVQATNAVAGLDYLCPDANCCGPVRLRKRQGYVAHFYHLGEARCPKEGESQEHEVAKIVLQELYRNRQIEAELEVYWSDVARLNGTQEFELVKPKLRAKDRRGDILLKIANADTKSKHFVIEVQGTKLSSSEFDGRIHDWNLIGIPVVWVALMKPSWLQKLTERETAHKLAKITLRDFEYKMMSRYGHIWYIDPELENLRKGTIESHQLFRNPKDYFDQNAGEMVADEGGYYSSSRWYDLILGQPIPIKEVGLKRIVRKLKNGVKSEIYDWCERIKESKGHGGT